MTISHDWAEIRIPRIGDRARGYYLAKRSLDLAFGVILLLLALPVLGAIAALIRLDSPGPVLFRQTRIGSRPLTMRADAWEIRPFTLYKFRTMRWQADESVHREYIAAYIQGDDETVSAAESMRSEGSYKLGRDSRITRVGRLLREFSLDELPQLWNVVRGDISLVGPRPPIDYEVPLYGERHMRRFATPQGLTGWWQVRGRATTPFEEMIDLDLEYIARQSLVFDLRIVFLTLPAVLAGEGAG